MNVRYLIEQLQKLPPEVEIGIRVVRTGDEHVAYKCVPPARILYWPTRSAYYTELAFDDPLPAPTEKAYVTLEIYQP